MDKTTSKRVNAKTEAARAVVQVYWNNDQACKQAKVKRDRARDLALIAVPLGATAGPAADDDGMPHWLTHGEKERVEMSAVALWNTLADTTSLTVGDIMELCDVNVSRLKELLPKAYARMLKHRTTRRTTHPCLTWSEKPRRVVTRSTKR